MRVINLGNEADRTQGLYRYDKVGSLNGHVLNVVRVENRTLDFHVHEQSDELFYVIEGQFVLETEDQRHIAKAGELIIVPKGVCHRPVVKRLTKFLMMELEGTLNRENSGEQFEE